MKILLHNIKKKPAASCRLSKALLAMVAIVLLFLCCTANVFAVATNTFTNNFKNFDYGTRNYI